MAGDAGIPSYDFSRGDELAIPFRFLLLDRSDGSYNASEPHRHNYYELFYFVQGGGEHDIDFQSYAILDNSLHVVTPGQVHQIRRAPDSHGYIILFTAEFYALSLHGHELNSGVSFLNPGPPSPVLHPNAEEQEQFLATIRMIQGEVQSTSPYREEMLRSYLNILLLHARRLFSRSGKISGEEHPEHELVGRLRSLIEQHFTEEHAPSAYAEMLNVSRNHLNTTVRKMLGTTIGGLINERLVLEAKRLLYHTEMSVKEIAYTLNFDDPSYFTRFFGRHAGMAPHDFREQIREQKV